MAGWRRTGFVAGLALLAAVSTPAHAKDELITSVHYADGEPIPYILTLNHPAPKHAVILMPGGPGNLSPQLGIDGQISLKWGGNFLIRSRNLFAAPGFVAVSADATTTAERVMLIVADLKARFGAIDVYVASNSRSSESTMALGTRIDGKVAGFIHTSSLNAIASYDTRGFKSRHLIVAHAGDSCTATSPSAAEANHRRYGTPLIVMQGGLSVGGPCEAFAHHGFNGIEKETVEKISAWIVAAN